MSAKVPTIADDIIEAVREDDFEDFVAQMRERQQADAGCLWQPFT
jgi:hypothetical protein